MELFSTFRKKFLDLIHVLQEEGSIKNNILTDKITSESPKDPLHGDISTNIAMVIAKQLKIKPFFIANKLVNHLEKISGVSKVQIAGPGFINLFLDESFWIQNLKKILNVGSSYGDLSIGIGKKVNIEYVSVNPTGPMHIGHSRGAVMGDVQASLFEKAGYEVIREYYINDAGSQMKELSRAVYSRYLQSLGLAFQKINSYSGDYLIEVGKSLANRDKDKWVNVKESVWIEPISNFAKDAMMDIIRKDLKLLGVTHDVFISEKTLVNNGKVKESIDFLVSKGLVYKGILNSPKGERFNDWKNRFQFLFRATLFGDDIDRSLTKSNGDWTYFATDIAYHMDKYHRGSGIIINVWGADHGGYQKRLHAAVNAITEYNVSFKVHLCSMVRFLENGHPYKMSKRKGSFISIKDVIEKVGRDSLRFMMMIRRLDVPLDFDFSEVIKQSKDNPIFYIQYAYTRSCSVKRYVRELFPDLTLDSTSLMKSNFSFCKDELSLIKVLSRWPHQVLIAVENQKPYRLAFYLYDVAVAFHSLWSLGKENDQRRFVDPNDMEMTISRFALVQAVRNILLSGLSVFGIKPLEKM